MSSMDFFVRTAKAIIDEQSIDMETYHYLAKIKDRDTFHMMAGADMIREKYFKNQVHLCAICNGKSGKCSENCRFCSQSKYYHSDIGIYPLMEKEALCQGALDLMETPVNRYSIVTSGRGLPKNEVRQVADALSALPSERMAYCVSLGILDKAEMRYLKKSGVSRYHHNLETSRSHFSKVCTTHSYDDRVNTIKEAKNAGLSVCAGGLFGMGETMEQVLELALELKKLDVDAVPINFLTPIAGTPMENQSNLTPLRCLKIIGLMRYLLPDKEIIICGGRLMNLKMLHPLIFHAGASGIMTGNYLTTEGNQLDDDLDMIQQIGFEPRF